MPAAYRQRVDEMAQRYLARDFAAEDGLPRAAVDEAQRRLGMRIPASLAYYYQRAGCCAALNALHHRLYAPAELLTDGGFIVFMDENQSVVSWGFRAADCHEHDPIVWQRNNTPPQEWYSEDKRFTRFLASMFDWYVETGILRR
jgi:hypothetical protein